MIKFEGWELDFTENEPVYQEIFRSGMMAGDAGIEFLETRVCEISNRKYAVACNNATDALYFSLIAHGIMPGDEVLVTDFSFIASASPISMAGAIPVFCDINLETYHISLDSIKRMVSDKTKAIIYTHLFGSMSADYIDVLNFCKERNIVFIEDAAQSLGSSLNGIRAGSIGDCSSYSFNSNKVIAGISGGGVYMTDDASKAEYVKKLRRHGGSASNFEMLGRNSKMSYMNAKVIDYRLQNYQEYQSKRQDIAKEYDDALHDLPVFIQKVPAGLVHNYHKYTIRFESSDDRKFARDTLRNQNISAAVHYERPMSANTMYDHIEHRKDNCVNSKLASETILSIPIHAWIADRDLAHITNVLSILA